MSVFIGQGSSLCAENVNAYLAVKIAFEKSTNRKRDNKRTRNSNNESESVERRKNEERKAKNQNIRKGNKANNKKCSLHESHREMYTQKTDEAGFAWKRKEKTIRRNQFRVRNLSALPPVGDVLRWTCVRLKFVWNWNPNWFQFFGRASFIFYLDYTKAGQRCECGGKQVKKGDLFTLKTIL